MMDESEPQETPEGFVDESAGGSGEDMSIMKGLRNLKPWSYLFLLSLVAVLILMCVWFWQCMFISLLILAPSVKLVMWWRDNSQYCPLDHLISSYAQGFVIIFVCVNISGFIAFTMASAILFVLCDEGFWLWLVDALRFSVWVTIEEAWKLGFALWDKQRRAHRTGARGQETKAHVMATTAAALGFASAQAMLIVVVTVAILGADGEVDGEETAWLAVFAFLFGAVSMPLNVGASYLEGLELTRDTPFHTAILWPAGVRCLYVSQFFFWMRCFMYVSLWVVFFVVTLSVAGVYYLMIWRIRKVEAELPFERMNDATRLRELFGFNLLSGDDDDDAPAGGGATELSGGAVAVVEPAALPPVMTVTAVPVVAGVDAAADGGGGGVPVKAIPMPDDEVEPTRLSGGDDEVQI